jgi:hypothetical protein
METLEQILSNLMTMIQQNEKIIESPPKPPPPIIRISDKSDKSDKRPLDLPHEREKPIFRASDWKRTSLADRYIGRVYGSEQPDSPPPPQKPDPLRPHEYPLKIVRHRGNPTDRTNFTHLQELWDGIEKPLEIQTAGHRERNLTTQIK